MDPENETQPGTDPTSGETPPAPQPLFTADDLERAREEEKNKLYRSLEKSKADAKTMRDELAQLRAWREEQEAAIQAQKAAEEDAQRRAAEEEMSAKELIKTKEREWQERLNAFERERQEERAALEKEREFAAIKAYISQRAREEQQKASIAPELIDLINGDTQEEVEASIMMLQQKTDAIVTNLTQAQRAQRAAVPGVSTAGYAAAGGPMDNEPGTKTLTPDEIRAMPMSEWQKIRGQVIGAASASSRGMFG